MLFTRLCNHRSCNSSTFSSLQRNLISINSRSPFPPPTSLATTNPLSLFMRSYKWIIQHVVFCGWLLSLSIMFSGFTHVVAWISMLFFLWLNYSPLYVDTTFLFTDLSDDVHLGCFHLAVMNDDTVNFYVQVFLWTYAFISLGYIARSGISGSCGNYT